MKFSVLELVAREVATRPIPPVKLSAWWLIRSESFMG
jgi:hypothetical protein